MTDEPNTLKDVANIVNDVSDTADKETAAIETTNAPDVNNSTRVTRKKTEEQTVRQDLQR